MIGTSRQLDARRSASFICSPSCHADAARRGGKGRCGAAGAPPRARPCGADRARARAHARAGCDAAGPEQRRRWTLMTMRTANLDSKLQIRGGKCTSNGRKN